MNGPVLYDIGKLVGYLFRPTPAGIPRIDLTYCRHILDGGLDAVPVWTTPLGVRAVSRARLARLYDAVQENWREHEDDSVAARVQAWLSGQGGGVRRVRRESAAPVRVLSSLRSACTSHPFGEALGALAPGTLYLNTSYASLGSRRSMAALSGREDLRQIFMVHDLIPLDFPEYFWRGHPEHFRTMLDRIVRQASAVIVPSEDVRTRLLRHAAQAGRGELKVQVLPFPPPEAFAQAAPETQVPQTPYMVVCSTIEPRKNHLLLLNLWRQMIQNGLNPPRLVVVGARGWENEQIVDLLDRSPSLRGHVLEVSDLSTLGLAGLIRHARALLMPSFAEGFGLPIIEALALGTPVIASDIPVFREVSRDGARLIDPLDAIRWQGAILELAHDDAAFERARAQAKTYAGGSWSAYFAALGSFLAAL